MQVSRKEKQNAKSGCHSVAYLHIQLRTVIHLDGERRFNIYSSCLLVFMYSTNS